MTLSKAVEILTLMGKPEFRGHTEDILAARQLGIEALKRLKSIRVDLDCLPASPLPGETED